MCETVNADFRARSLPISLQTFSSWFRIVLHEDPYGLVRELLILLLRHHGVETSVSGNNFLNLAHTDDDLQAVIDAFRRVADELVENGFFFEEAAEEQAIADIVPHHAPAAAPMPASTVRAKASPPVNAAALRELLTADLRAVAARS